MKRHLETVLRPTPRQINGEQCESTLDAAPNGWGADHCRHLVDADTPSGIGPCCHGGHGRHRAARPSSSAAGLASFRSAR